MRILKYRTPIGHKTFAFTGRFRQEGATLLEALIALLIFSFALLGIAGMQLSSMKATQSSGFRAVASEQATFIAERIRANPLAVNDYVTAMSTTTGSQTKHNCSKTYPDGTTGLGVPCTPTNAALDDAFTWTTAIQRLLPVGTGVVCFDDSPNPDNGTSAAPGCGGVRRLVIKIFWDDSRGAGQSSGDAALGTGTAQRFVTVFQP